MQIQLILEQHRFELHGSTYTWIFFSSEYCSTSRSALVDSADVEPRIQETADTEEPQIWGNSRYGGPTVS